MHMHRCVVDVRRQQQSEILKLAYDVCFPANKAWHIK